MKIYTKGGDGGETGLFGGERVRKDAPRIMAYGEVDELNSLLGWCAVVAVGTEREKLRRTQAQLFSLGSWLATPQTAAAATRAQLPPWDASATPQLEEEIDAWEEALEPLKNFILPGGVELAARLHMARSLCRRAERAVTAFHAMDPSAVEADHLRYLNRLSDWLFVFARYVNHSAGESDVAWQANGK